MSIHSFHYSAEGYEYELVPVWHHTPGGNVYCSGAKMYRPDHVYVGYWERYNMPMKLVHQLQSWCKARDWEDQIRHHTEFNLWSR